MAGGLAFLGRNFCQEAKYQYPVLRGNAVFTVEFIGENRRAGTLFLVHPVEKDGSRFLPCCYGYGTTIRRAQGASLVQGCLWFDQHKHAAGRGYGYVGVSRFRSRSGCYIFGKLRRTDFLPVGAPNPAIEVLEREADSESENSDDEYACGLAARDWGDGDESDCDDPEAGREHVVRGDVAPHGADVSIASVGFGSFGAGLSGEEVSCLDDFA